MGFRRSTAGPIAALRRRIEGGQFASSALLCFATLYSPDTVSVAAPLAVSLHQDQSQRTQPQVRKVRTSLCLLERRVPDNRCCRGC
eukprot:577233-Rhodomonas_salina.2